MPAHSNIQPLTHADHACLQLTTRHGTAIVALHGAQILSWQPTGHREVLWLSPTLRPAPAAIRGGVPICWPWFGKQGMPSGAMQHGPVRNRPWDVASVQADSDTHVSLTLAPQRAATSDDPLARYAPGLTVTLQIDLGETLAQTLETHNQSGQPFALTQALHSYFAVHDATQVQVAELADLPYDDKLSGATQQQHTSPFVLDQACDRVYQQTTGTPTHHYTLEDRAWQRRIHVTTQGSQSLVVWNPGVEQARTMADVPETAAHAFLCLEASNAGADVVTLAPGAQHRLTQTLAVTHW
ncbi:MAG: D-hexose-6-phosphate mutarotase [Pseudomonadota bacterium]